jgi:hypothetical protein
MAPQVAAASARTASDSSARSAAGGQTLARGLAGQCAERDDRPAAATALRARLVEQANEVELVAIPRRSNAGILTAGGS